MRSRMIVATMVATMAMAAAAYAEAPVTVSNAYTPPTLAGTQNGVVYMTITSKDSDTLTGATTDAAKAAELHNHIMNGSIMQMRKVDKIELPAGKPVELKSGSYHVMLFDVKAPLEIGETLPLTLHFAHAQPLKLNVPVRAQPEQEPMAGMQGVHSMH